MKRLSIVTNSDNSGDDNIFIIGSDKNARLAYKKDNNVIILSEGSSNTRAIHCSELHTKLEKRGWNLMGTKYIRNTGNVDDFDVCYKTSLSSGEVDTIGYNDGFSVCSTLTDENTTIIDAVTQEYINLFGDNMNTTEEVNFFNSSKNVVDFLDNTVRLDLIDYNSDVYTNVISLEDLAKYKCEDGIFGLVNLSIQYTKYNQDTEDNQVHASDISFNAFNYSKNPTDNSLQLNFEQLVEIINSEVAVECFEGMIRVYSIVSNIDECIITNCTITYGNNK